VEFALLTLPAAQERTSKREHMRFSASGEREKRQKNMSAPLVSSFFLIRIKF
jgi:hypothetical protein